jgi:MFS family permease
MNRQLRFLFLSNFAILFTGMGLFPVLPLYAARFGASSSMIGLYMALTYVSITAGTILTGWLAGRVPRKHIFLAAGLAGLPALVALGQAVSFVQVIVLTGIVWFSGGVGLALVNVLTGLATDQKFRGRAYSLQALASPVSALAGGLAVGRLVEWRGYPLMFAVLAAVWAIWPVLAFWKIEYSASADRPSDKGLAPATRLAAANGGLFSALLAGILLSAVTVSIGRLGLSLVMKAQSFPVRDITSTSFISGLVALPVIFLTGSAADRLGKQRVLVLGYLVAAAGTAMLIFAHQLWQFWVAAILLLVALNSNRSLATATAAELLAPAELARKLPWTATASWMAGVIGYAATGYAIEKYGVLLLFSLAAALSLVSALLIVAPTLPGSARLRHAVWQRPAEATNAEC